MNLPVPDDTFITGGSVAIILYMTYRIALVVVSAWNDHQNRPADRAAADIKAASVADAETANSLLLASLEAKSTEVQELSDEVSKLRDENTQQYQRYREAQRAHEAEIAAMRREHLQEIGELREELNKVAMRLERYERSKQDDS